MGSDRRSKEYVCATTVTRDVPKKLCGRQKVRRHRYRYVKAQQNRIWTQQKDRELSPPLHTLTLDEGQNEEDDNEQEGYAPGPMN